MMDWDALDWTIIGPALAAGLLVLWTHVPLGQVVLQRGIIFIDLAIAQVAALGVIAAGSFGWEENLWAVQASAVGAALLAAAGLNWTEKRWEKTQEALIGTLFVLAATGSILLLAENPHGCDYLWTTWVMLVPIAILYSILMAVWFFASERVGHAGFYIIFAFVVTAAVQAVGVYLVFASLILPALATRRLNGRRRLLTGYAIGALSYLFGIVISALADLPTGAVTVWTMALFSVMAGFAIGAITATDQAGEASD
jgi:zinc/manganese transport system permease protein